MTHIKRMIGEYAIIKNSKDEFLMLQFPAGVWHFPGGRIEEGEEAFENLLSEVKEETSLEIYDIKPVYTKLFDDKFGVFYTAKCKEPCEVKISHEHQAYKWYTKDDLDKIDFWQPFYKEMLEKYL